MSHLKSILLWTWGKIRNFDHPYHFSGTLTQKSIQWFRLQINDPVSIQPKHYTEMEKKVGHWTRVSKIKYLTIQSIRRKCERLSRQTPHIPTGVTEQPWWDLVWWKNRSILVTRYVLIFIDLFPQVIKISHNISWRTFIFRITTGLELSFCLV